VNIPRAIGVTTICVAALATAFPITTLAGSRAAAIEPASAAPAKADDRPMPESVLFIGNSHTERNGGLGWMVGNFVAAEGTDRPYQQTALTEGGVSLEYHWDHGAAEVIRDGDFDAVVLQGYLAASETGTIEPFLEYARRFDEVIRASGAETVFFMTWPNGVDDWSTLEDVVEAHRTIATELGAPVAPAALAFEQARAERPDLELIGPDRVHATWAGAYLAAATVYATLFDRSPEGLPYAFGLDPEVASFLQRVAWETVSEWETELGS
jgi:hypothetical protein